MRRQLRLISLLLLHVFLSGCAELQYYGHAVSGQLEVLGKRRPIPEVIADPATGSDTRQRLVYLEQVREFAIRDMHLPDSDSYRSYSDLGRPYVLWNVFATPTLSLAQKQWCYPLLGCLGYRSYFEQAYAEQVAAELKHEGWDVHIVPSPAYSTRGIFADPVYNPLLRYPDVDLAAILFHELAHEKVYMKDDSTANESFAVAVQLEGVKRWLEYRQLPELFRDYELSGKRDEEFTGLLIRYREKLATLYNSKRSDEDKRKARQVIFNELRVAYAKQKQAWGDYSGYDHWFEKPLNNAVLAPVGTYHGDVAAFRQLLAEQGNDLAKFYAAALQLAELDTAARRAQLARLHERATR